MGNLGSRCLWLTDLYIQGGAPRHIKLGDLFMYQVPHHGVAAR